MFTGIVQTLATITHIQDHQGIRTFTIAFPAGFCQDLQIGASIAIDGVCLTVTTLVDSNTATFDVILQSMLVTTLGEVRATSQVNAERAAKEGAEIGGHPLSGHIDFRATLITLHKQENNACLRFSVPKPWMRYIFPKGYIALNGTSLTVSEVNKKADWFEVWLIPETRRMTTFESKQIGDAINVEIERGTQVVVDTIRDALEENLGKLLPTLERILAEQELDLADLARITPPDTPKPSKQKQQS